VEINNCATIEEEHSKPVSVCRQNIPVVDMTRIQYDPLWGQPELMQDLGIIVLMPWDWENIIYVRDKDDGCKYSHYTDQHCSSVTIN
jgi:hypothetical protein